MKRKVMSVIMVALLLIGILTLAFSIQPVRADTITVPDDYLTIQEAINAADIGDTIYVRAGTYHEEVVVNKTVSLIGESRDNTLIIANANVVHITAHNVQVSGFLIILGDETGILIDSANNTTISHCSIATNQVGIAIENSYYNTIINNRIDYNRLAGISLYLSHNNTIINNTISNTTQTKSSIGIGAYQSNNSAIYHNNFINNLWNPFGYRESFNKWDDDYPSGGNYWDMYMGSDLFSGPYQNETGSDGIGDTPYTINVDNQDRYPLMKPYVAHDIGITDVTPSGTLVFQGNKLGISTKVVNYGVSTETFNITAYANATIIQTKNVTLSSRNSITVTFTWNTAGFAIGYYTISAYAWPVPNETDTTDNNFTDGTVIVAAFGDFNGDGKVSILDLVLLAKEFGQTVPPADPLYDLNGDGGINILDLVIEAAHFGK